jgi:voltage-gated potassium channel
VIEKEEARRTRVLLPSPELGPLRAVLYRLGAAFALLVLVVLVVYLDRRGYRDGSDDSVDLLDAVYYTTVTMSTTGYGDITPVSDSARLVNVLLVTPARVLFLIVLVGTTLEVLAERTRHDWRLARWRERLRNHIVVAGYGTKGRSAIRTMLTTGCEPGLIVVVDPDAQMVAEARADGFAAVHGDATRRTVLLQAGVDRAKEVVVAAQRDDTAVLITLTARQLNPKAGIRASVRESENAPLVRQSGADHVVTSSEAAGRLLGMSTSQPSISEVMEDLLEQGRGLDMTERPVRPEEVGRPISETREPAIAIVRDGRLLPYTDRACAHLQADDRVVVFAVGRNEKSTDSPDR